MKPEFRVFWRARNKIYRVLELTQGEATVVETLTAPHNQDIIFPDPTGKSRNILMQATPFSYEDESPVFELDIVMIGTGPRADQVGMVTMEGGCWLVGFKEADEDGDNTILLYEAIEYGIERVGIAVPSDEYNPRDVTRS